MRHKLDTLRAQPLLHSGGLWWPLAASGCLWRPLAASGGLWQPLAASGGLQPPLAASGGLWWPLAATRTPLPNELELCFHIAYALIACNVSVEERPCASYEGPQLCKLSARFASFASLHCVQKLIGVYMLCLF